MLGPEFILSTVIETLRKKNTKKKQRKNKEKNADTHKTSERRGTNDSDEQRMHVAHAMHATI